MSSHFLLYIQSDSDVLGTCQAKKYVICLVTARTAERGLGTSVKNFCAPPPPQARADRLKIFTQNRKACFQLQTDMGLA